MVLLLLTLLKMRYFRVYPFCYRHACMQILLIFPNFHLVEPKLTFLSWIDGLVGAFTQSAG